MKIWQRFILILMIGSFPFALVALKYSAGINHNRPQETVSAKASPRSMAPAANPVVSPRTGVASINASGFPREIQNLERGIDSKVKEIKDLDVKITETRGEIVKLEEKKGQARKDLESLYNKISDIIDGTSGRDRTNRSANVKGNSEDSR
jgi:peptidoglycan hydrolase CwlO-like protein